MQRLSTFAMLSIIVVLGIPSAHGWEIEDKKWIKASSENYVIYSRMSKRRTVDLLNHLEAFRTLTGVKPGSDKVPTLIIAAGRESEFVELGGGEDYAGYFLPRLRSNYIFLRIARGMEESGVVMHEYGHSLLNKQSSYDLPIWYQEGYAEYLSTVKVRKDKVEVFSYPEHRVPSLSRNSWLPARKLISPPSLNRMNKIEREMFYAQSWALVHFLLRREDGGAKTDDSLKRYSRALAQGGTRIAAFEAAFDLQADTLNERLRHYVFKECCQIRTYSLQQAVDASKIESKRANKGEVAISLARLSRAFGEHESAMRLYSSAVNYAEYRDEALAGIGTMADEAGDRETAAAAFAKIDGSSSIATLDLAYHYERKINRTESLDEIGANQVELYKLIDTLRDSGDRSPEFLLLAARHSNSSHALALNEEAYLALPSNREIQAALVNGYANAGKYSDAIAFARIFKRRNFESPDFVAWLQNTIDTLESQLDTIESFSD